MRNDGYIRYPCEIPYSEKEWSKNMQLINIGFGNLISASRVIAMVSPDSAPIKRLIQDTRDTGKLIDVTCGRRTRAVIITDSDHIILSAIQPETRLLYL